MWLTIWKFLYIIANLNIQTNCNFVRDIVAQKKKKKKDSTHFYTTHVVDSLTKPMIKDVYMSLSRFLVLSR